MQVLPREHGWTQPRRTGTVFTVAHVWETTLMQTSPKPPQRLEDRKTQKLMERIEKQKLQQKAPAPKQCPSAA